MYLVDTNVISATAPTKSGPNRDLTLWMDRHSADLYLSVITVAEVEDGIARSRRGGAHAKATRLTAWLDLVVHLYGSRILPIDVTTARQIGVLMDRARQQGQAPGLADAAIAATALVHGYVVLTRNLRHFQPHGIAAFDPFSRLPDGA